ncbi:LutC/YkgG family protein [Streptomyces spirodelae]|uniref:LUD domain-containing protein n=1 Tax=Streptomyces spirodelae TaxID=2812904 RepID=A0ABS3WUC8_9ACTN|nr:LUD domain-containing protein [Streptomyces spirodelae]MBO8186442.1 LUD domain-containing protein [Streptomyces spirodelae]
MNAARDEILARVRAALADVPEPERPADVPVARQYATGADAPAGVQETVSLFVERLADYGASVRTVSPAQTGTEVAKTLASWGAEQVLVPRRFPAPWSAHLPAAAVLGDEGPLSADDLDAVDAVVTTAAAAIAVTGTLVLDGGPGQGRRAATLVPDRHLCVLRAEQVVASVPEALSRLDPLGPLTFVSGPSATSDIELERVAGVHGPRTLEVLVVR